MYKMPPKRNKRSARVKKRTIGRNVSHHNNHININLSGISRRRKGTGTSRGSHGKTSALSVPQPLITRFASTFAPDGKTQLINPQQVPVLGQQQSNVLQQSRDKTQEDGNNKHGVEERLRKMRDIYTSPVKPTKTQEEPIKSKHIKA